MTFFVKKCFASVIVVIAIVAVVDGNLCAHNANRMRTLMLQKKKRAVPSKPSVPEPTVDMDKQFPLQTGNYWLYKGSVEFGNNNGGTTKSNVPRRVQVISRKKDPNQTIIKLKNEDYNGSSLITYVIRGRRIYEFDEFDSSDWETRRALSDEKVRFVFPLSVNQEWGNIEDRPRNTAGLYCYIVEEVEDVTVPAGTFHDCFRITFRSIADELVQWFKPGVGVVKSTYHHNGSIDDELYELEAYKIDVVTTAASLLYPAANRAKSR